MNVRILTYQDTVNLLKPKDCVQALRSAFLEQSKGKTANRPRSHSQVMLEEKSPDDWTWYALKSMDGVIKTQRYAAIRIGSFKLHHLMVAGRPREEYATSISAADGQPRWFEIVMLFDIDTCKLVAVMPDGHIQGMRVGGSTAIGNSYMARKDSSVFGIIGSGWQARFQLLTHNEIFKISQVKVYSPTASHRESFAKQMTLELGVPVKPVESAEEASRNSDVLLCATTSHNPEIPVFKVEWLSEGTHWSVITREAGKDAFEKSDRVAALSHIIAQNAMAPEDRQEDYVTHTLEQQPVDVKSLPTLSDLISGRIIGRKDNKEITGFVTTQGMGIQFVALASLAYQQAEMNNVGLVQNWEHLLQPVHP